MAGVNHIWCCLFLVTATLTLDVSGCGGKCTCFYNKANCANLQLMEIPAELPSNITTLDVRNNLIDNLDQSSLSHLQGLVTLKLAGNLLKRIHNRALQNMKHLSVLDLSGNGLTAVTIETFRGSQNLVYLDLSGNQIEYISGAFLGLRQLTKLKLTQNRLIQISEHDFKDLTSLQQLDLSYNQLVSLSPLAFRGLHSVVDILLQHNPLEVLPSLKFNTSSLSFVDLSECHLTQVPRNFPSSVHYLQFQKNNITVVRRKDFQGMSHLTTIILDENKISRIESYAFHGASSLQQLWLNKNQIREIPKNLPFRLERLYMQSNKVEKVGSWDFVRGNNLKMISLVENNISHINWNALHTLTKVNDLDLSNNNIKMLTNNMFYNMTDLRTLKLSKNPIQYMYPDCFKSLPQLRTLNLAYINTKKAMLADNVFENLKSLKKLTLDTSPAIAHAVFSSKPLLQSLTQVEDLSMRHTDFTTMRHDFLSFFGNLKTLHISSSRWHCDSRLIWFKDYLLTTSIIEVDDKETLTCLTPNALYGKPIIHLKDGQFVPATTPPPTQSTSGKRKFPVLPPTTTQTKPSERYDPFSSTTLTPSTTKKVRRGPKNPDKYNNKTSPAVDGSMVLSTVALYSTVNPGEGHLEKSVSNTSASSNAADSPSKITIISVAVLITITVIVIVVVATIIILLKCRDRKKGEYKNAVQYKHKNNVLYFMPKEDPNNTSNDGTLLSTSSSKDGITLVPGRDITQEGPLRVYKWEEF